MLRSLTTRYLHDLRPSILSHLGAARPNFNPRLFHTSIPLERYLPIASKYSNLNADMAPKMTTKAGKPLDKEQLDSLLKRRMFFTPAFEIHGAVKGLFGKIQV
jgi:hypothetical protein